MQKERHHGLPLWLYVNNEFQDSISLLCVRFFSPFPHGTRSLLVLQSTRGRAWSPYCSNERYSHFTFKSIVPASSHQPHQYGSKKFFAVRDFHLRWFTIQHDFRSKFFLSLSRVRSPLLTMSLVISFLKATKMFQFTLLKSVWHISFAY